MMKAVSNKKLSICILADYSISDLKDLVNSISNKFTEIEYEVVVFISKDTQRLSENLEILYDKIYSYNDEESIPDIISYIKEVITNEWILVLESDEVLEDIDENEIITLLNNDIKASCNIEITYNNIVGTMNIPYSLKKNRFFHKEADKNIELKKFNVTKKNYLLESINELKEKKFNDKIKNLNEKILENDEDPYGYFLMALAYLMDGRLEDARTNFLNALERPIDTNKGYVQIMIVLYGNLLLEMEEFGDALLLENLYEYFEGIADFLCLMGRIYLKTGFVAEAIREFSKALNTFCYIEYGSNSYVPNYYLGCIYEVAGDIEIAKKLYTRCGNYEPAVVRLESLQ